jgi:hypothetical protein
MAETRKKSHMITYVVYDKKTGRILHLHSSYNVAEDIYDECDPEEVKQLVTEDDLAMRSVTDSDPDNLEVLMAYDIPELYPSRDIGYTVDLERKTVVEKPMLQLSAEKTQLRGDGKDQARIEVRVVNKRGKVAEGYNGTVKVITSRGKLSASAGRVNVKRGVGSIELTSVNETVHRVNIRARCLDGKCISTSMNMEFV